MTEYQTITFEQSGPITRITLNRPDAANGMNDTMTRELADAAKRCDTDATKVVVSPDRADSSAPEGISSRSRRRQTRGPLHQGRGRRPAPRDLDVRADGRRADHRGQRRGRRRRLLLAVTGDLVLAAESASFTMAYTQAPVSAPTAARRTSCRGSIGITKTKELMLTNRTLSAQEASQWGLVTEVVPDAELAARADELAEQMASTARGSNGAVKALHARRPSPAGWRSRWSSRAG